MVRSRAGDHGATGSFSGAMSTRRLIFAALVCGLAILVAFTVQILIAR
jgi:hypothetical protein